ncbi:tRNA 2-thiouridine(34) synthase MnmA [Bacteroides xylanisolvens]|jgi:tRNA-specific 2-thiouridylase|uniref:tRNA-specific 2-thiouridylase MnmA n=1 Tax=Bacteroides xylanisolvens TaxID=371601 RepID=A0AAW4SW42_9BACE|nr:tRNA 2-thiouridine(34) synthase MnmA [Bacteroides xylanisolvens]MCA4533275.1 tRNA 2-thiouridine(34) synthase MnmA [Bacteroides xylanisolvens]MCA4551387.1 tRNA 2-thiouridine(34) synthase MnmA [Bacteroides xylanisolvens]MCA4564937.1 tRNA 2-thiouridine(34) synthase MnmA [Bacteroides xylanisolvens]MCA4569878.1 tRNA 2-thiouridine(34) synthase MnmA [Bacteroides xylanisolvens]MCA4600661.1 tRNA 2-thiouridine(34) synthase MnmA [Bacteroides xylanisolvens]
MIEENKRVLLGMSGGTDSSVAAMRLLEAGYEVIGVTFRFYELNGSTEYLEDARNLAERLGIRHITYDAREIFAQQIIEYFVQEYLAGRTPVPCTLCNNYLKWPLLAKIADEMGLFYIATGHYAQNIQLNETFYITYAADSDKDQTFFLWGLKQDILNRMLLPMGDITKAEARSWAAEHGFRKVATKKDSIGVCFCPMDYRTFLKDWLVRNGQMSVSNSEASINNSQTSGSDKQAWSDRIRRGRFVDEKGTFIAWHEGYPFYTIGQRRGLGIHLNRPVFVKEIDPEKNEVVLASLSSLEKTEMWLKDWNLVNQERTLGRSDIIVKIRYRKQENYGTITVTSDHLLHVQLHEPLTAIAPGQAAAFYGDGLLLGGGIIVNAR